MTKLYTSHCTPSELSETDIHALYQLYGTYYGGTSPELFRRDLFEKDRILLLHDHEFQQIRGFSTLKIIPFTHDGQQARAIFSGDTIIDHHYWGEQTLPLAWCELIGEIASQQPEKPLYWLLIVKGDRTYRYLNIFSKTYYPNRRYATPPAIQAIINQLATQRFGEYYCAQTGIVHYPQTHGYLKPEWANPDTSSHPEARYFAERNPHHADGDELVCLTALCADNLRSFALRGFQQGWAKKES